MPVTDRNQGIEQWWIDTYEMNVLHGLQQRESRLEGTVRNFVIDGEARRFNYIEPREMKPLDIGLGDTEFEDSKHDVRWAYSKPFYDAFLVDPKNVEKSFTDPSSDMTSDSVSAARRMKDRVIIKAFKAPVIAGHDKDQVLTFPTANILDVRLGSASNTGLTLAKLKEIKYRMDCAEIDELDPRYFLITAKQLQNLLNTTEITNSDYNTVKALVEGKVDEFLGFKFIRLELLPIDLETRIRSCFAYTRNSMVFGVRKGITVEAGKIPQKHFAKGVEIQIDYSALRVYDEGVYEIPCDETV